MKNRHFLREHQCNDEILDLVDEQDRVIGCKSRNEVSGEGLSNFRIVNAFLVNSDGELWISRRNAKKQLDTSVGGPVKSSESYEGALRRLLREELRLDFETVSCRLLGRLTPHEHEVSSFMHVYEVRYDETPNFNRKDFMSFHLLDPLTVSLIIYHGDWYNKDLPKLVRRFYGT